VKSEKSKKATNEESKKATNEESKKARGRNKNKKNKTNGKIIKNKSTFFLCLCCPI
jgi:hypothetical protein